MSNSVPNLFLIGAPKSGSTSVALNISQCADIFLPERKEPRYFDACTYFDYSDDYRIKTQSEYLDLYNGTESFKYKMDASVFNMYSEKSIKNILQFNPDSKFLLILRDPVEASVSMHKQRLKYIEPNMREVSRVFQECWNLLEKRQNGEGYPKGCRNKFLFRYDLLFKYELYLPYLLNLIPNEQLLVLFYEDLINNDKLFYRKIFEFLGLEDFLVENKKFNDSKVIPESGLRKIIYWLALKNYSWFRYFDRNKAISGFFTDFIFVSPSKLKIDSTVSADVNDYFAGTRRHIADLKEKYYKC